MRRAAAGVALGLTLLTLSACGSLPGAKAPPPARHLVLVTIDTLRADRLGCYGSTTVATPHLDEIQRRGDSPTAEAIAWLEAHPTGRLFVWLHLYDPHEPYEPPEPYASRYSGRPYDGEVAWSDELVGRLDAALERLGLRKDTLL